MVAYAYRPEGTEIIFDWSEAQQSMPNREDEPMTPQEDSKPGRTRREGNITCIQTEFATRVRFAVILLAKREARKAVIRQLKAEGHGPSLTTFSEINTLDQRDQKEIQQ